VRPSPTCIRQLLLTIVHPRLVQRSPRRLHSLSANKLYIRFHLTIPRERTLAPTILACHKSLLSADRRSLRRWIRPQTRSYVAFLMPRAAGRSRPERAKFGLLLENSGSACTKRHFQKLAKRTAWVRAVRSCQEDVVHSSCTDMSACLQPSDTDMS